MAQVQTVEIPNRKHRAPEFPSQFPGSPNPFQC
jgi:hypothetical protein